MTPQGSGGPADDGFIGRDVIALAMGDAGRRILQCTASGAQCSILG
ncbi:hypothetical protein JW848_02945 [Candidatus Bipolaricaulota bacterium]|nr:hypothetical protein [Candidatus Bipolaricaulota bacterium]